MLDDTVGFVAPFLNVEDILSLGLVSKTTRESTATTLAPALKSFGLGSLCTNDDARLLSKNQWQQLSLVAFLIARGRSGSGYSLFEFHKMSYKLDHHPFLRFHTFDSYPMFVNQQTVVAEVLRRGQTDSRCQFCLSHVNGLNDDKAACTIAVATTPRLLSQVSKRLRDDEDVVGTAISRDGSVFFHASKRLKSSESLAIQSNLHGADPELTRDKAVVLQALENWHQRGYGGANPLASVSDRLQRDRDVVALAIGAHSKGQDAYSFRFAPTYADDTVMATLAVQACGLQLRHCSARLRNDDAFVTMAVKQNAEALKYASFRVQSNTFL